jgi:hypothetical protein
MFFSSLLLYSSTLTSNYDGDGIQFAMTAESPNLRSITNPNHILFNYLIHGFYRLVQLCGWQGSALKPLQILNAIFGALAVALVFWIAAQVTKSLVPSLLTSAGFAVSAGVWLFSTDSESVVIPLVTILAVMLVLVVNPNPTSVKSPIALGILVSGAVLVYGTAVLLIFPVIAGYLSDECSKLRMRLRQSALFVAIAGIASLAAYASVAYVIVGLRSTHEMAVWYFNSSSSGRWGNWEFSRAMPGLVRAFIALPSLSDSSPSWKMPLTAMGFVVLFLVSLPLVAGYRLRSKMAKQHRRLFLIGAVWAVAFGTFTVYWVAGDPTFWVPVLIPWWILVAVVLTVANDSSNFSKWRFPATFVAVLLTASLNYFLAVGPNREATCDYRLAEMIQRETTPKDLVITTGVDKQFLFVPYFADRQVLPAHLWILGSRAMLGPGDWKSGQTIDSNTVAPAHRKPKKDALNAIENEVARVKAIGGRVILQGIYPAEDWRWGKFGLLGPEDFQRFTTREVGRVCGSTVLEIIN